jgi:hypothetical protein
MLRRDVGKNFSILYVYYVHTSQHNTVRARKSRIRRKKEWHVQGIRVAGVVARTDWLTLSTRHHVQHTAYQSIYLCIYSEHSYVFVLKCIVLSVLLLLPLFLLLLLPRFPVFAILPPLYCMYSSVYTGRSMAHVVWLSFSARRCWEMLSAGTTNAGVEWITKSWQRNQSLSLLVANRVFLSG